MAGALADRDLTRILGKPLAAGTREMLDEQALAAGAERSAQGVFDAVVEAVGLFRGSAPQRDDITLVVIKAL